MVLTIRRRTLFRAALATVAVAGGLQARRRRGRYTDRYFDKYDKY